jgi:SHS2 domain-containing protein
VGKQARTKPRFRTVDHTADVGIDVRGADLPELFENSAAGMFHLLYPGRRGRGGSQRYELELREPSREELLVGWLRELLYIHESESVFLSDFRVRLGDGDRLTGSCAGRTTDRSAAGFEIKLVTYHGLKIEKVDDLYRVRVIFDI